jgi:predicted ABC-type sugar transport system permease subunit
MSDQQKSKAKLKERAASELKRYAVIVLYLWVLFGLFELHKYAVLREVNLASLSGWKLGFALVNALILGKVILIGEAFHVGEQLSEKRLIYSVLFKSASFAALVVCFDIVEDTIVGLIHGKSVAASIPPLGGGGLEGKMLYGFMAFVVLIPFFLYTEIQEAIGKEKLHALILNERAKADAA